MNTHLETLKEFLYLVLASLSPIILGVIGVIFFDENIKISELLEFLAHSSKAFLTESVFAYVSTMVAPFIYIVIQLVTTDGKNKVKYGGVVTIATIIVIIVATSFYSYDKSSEWHSSKASQQSDDQINDNLIEEMQVDGQVAEPAKNGLVENGALSTKEWLLAVIYIIALMIWYYSIYLKNLDVSDYSRERKQKRDKMHSAADEVLES